MTHSQQVKHSIVLVTYNHEKSVRAALDAITAQSMAPFELVILDDCSTDGTVAIVTDYLSSGYCQSGCGCRVVVNEENLGIPKNMSKASQIAQGNVITIIGGDDLIEPGTVEAVDAAIRRQGLDPDSDRFVAFSSCIDRSPEVDRTLDYRIISDSPIKTMTRKTAPFVKVGFSAALLREASYPTDCGIWADWIWDIDLCFKADSYYEIPIPCYVHTASGGVSAATPQEQIQRSYLQSAEYILSHYGPALSVSDRLYLKGEICYLRGQVQSSSLYKIAGVFLAVINIWNFGGMIGLKSIAARYLPMIKIRKIRELFA